MKTLGAEQHHQETGEPPTEADAAMLLERGLNPHRPTLENRVAFQWELEGDTLGYRNECTKNRIQLNTLAAAVGTPAERDADHEQRAVLDVGCAYGNMLLMLNARLGKPANVRLVGVDLHPEGIQYGQAFARVVPGYGNCEYHVADLTTGLPFDDHTFDAVNLGDVLEHMPDPRAAVRELMRVAKPGGVLVISTPLKTGLFKTTARVANRLSGGRLYRSYYAGKDTPLDAAGEPVMHTPVGFDHISEMTFRQLRKLLTEQGLVIERCNMMPVMSGSRSFDRHPFLLSWLMFIEAMHSVFRLRSWAHSVILSACAGIKGGYMRGADHEAAAATALPAPTKP